MPVANDHLNDVLVQVAALQKLITCPYAAGTQTIQHAFTYVPFLTQSVDCPFFLNRVTGGGINFQTTMGTQRVPSSIEMNLAITRAEANSNLEEAQAEILRWRTPVFRAFAAHIRLGGAFEWLEEAVISKYVPFREFIYGETHYLASAFTLSVVELFPITIGI